ncbi:HsdM family class I SAM-dependent methyltransferase [Thiocystis minor]|uniref:HsdM family class I SAM-dependent methyltransferase n=1 Tax=Thiocystis minor TaxID=61597 RepID=UPI001F5D6EBF|nr:class I SAM-dependent DNA methyltransferase [Thiocystis minor]
MPRQKTASQSQPMTTAAQLGGIVKSARQIMRKDKGLSGELDRLPILTWIMFLKFLDDLEQRRETEAILRGKPFQPAIVPPYRWRDWATDEGGITGDELIAFINLERAVLPNGREGPGLFTYLRNLQGTNGGDRRDVIATVFKGLQNRMQNGYLLRDVINKVNGIHFNASDEMHTLSRLYETMLREMRDAAGDSGEFYTPRPVVRFMVEVTDPRLGETILDPACGTGGFLAEAMRHLETQCHSVEDRATLQNSTLQGGEAKPLPYLLVQMNLLLHGLEYPRIDPRNSLDVKLNEIGDRDRVDVILTNPPFGGEEEKGILGGFPEDMRTAETALLFLQLIMRKLRRPGQGAENGGRAAVVVPNGTLFADGIAARIKEALVKGSNLHTIVRLPEGVFSPYTDIPANLLFFDRSGPTQDIWFYQIPPPEGRKKYSKTKPMDYAEFEACLAWWGQREENARAWRLPFAERLTAAREQAQPHWDAAERARQEALETERTLRDLEKRLAIWRERPEHSRAEQERAEREIRDLKHRLPALRARQKEEQGIGDGLYWPLFNLDIKNPHSLEALEHRSPEALIAEMLEKERRVMEVMKEIEQLLLDEPV